MTFKPGDKVICIDPASSLSIFHLPINTILTVAKFYNGHLYFKDIPASRGYRATRFKLYRDNPLNKSPIELKIDKMYKRFENRHAK